MTNSDIVLPSDIWKICVILGFNSVAGISKITSPYN